MTLAISLRRFVVTAACAIPAAVSAQGAQAPQAPRIDISGILFGAYSYRTNPEAQNANKFDLERVYLNFRTPIAERWSLRYTPDISPQQSGVGYVLPT